MDILAALEASPSPTTGRRCRIQRFIDSIPENAAGRDELIATLTVVDKNSPHYRPGANLLALLARLGESTSLSTVLDHRSKRCVCNA